ncbi:MAG: tetratricopeptide repeat protein, partial [Gemmataceae bacterium]|nr:tetratricopeptide repeat protein [Gemmataceae bacterium]
MRKINGKLFLALLLGTVAVGVGVFLLHRFQHGRIGAALLWQARHAEEQGEPAKQARYLQRYLEFNPGDLREKAALAKLWAGDGTSGPPKLRARAVRLLDEVLIAEDDPELRRLLVKTALGLRDSSAARDHLKKLLKPEDLFAAVAAEREARLKKQDWPADLREPDAARGQLEAWWGQILEEEKKNPEAESCYRLAMRHAPDVQAGFIRFAYLLRRDLDGGSRKERLAEADLAMTALVDKNPSAHDSYLSRWRYRRDFDLLAVRETAGKGRVPLEDAAEDVTQALKRKPESADVLLAAADLERLRSRVAAEDPARTPAQREAGRKAHRDRASAHLEAGLKLAKEKKGAASDETGEFPLLWHKSNLLLDDLDAASVAAGAAEPKERTAGLLALAEEIGKKGIAGTAEYVKGRVALHERRWAEAASLFERARTSLAGFPDLAAQADLYLGQCYQRLEEPTQMFNAFKRVSDWDPASIPARMGMAAARLAQGQLEDAKKHFDTLKNHGQLPGRAWIDLARVEMQRQAQADVPDWREALALLDHARKAGPAIAAESAVLAAEVRFRQGKPDEARDVLESARDAAPDNPDLWAALADLAGRRKDVAGARRLLAEAEGKCGDKVALRLAKARLGGAGDAAKDRGKFSEEEQGRLLGGLADIALRDKRAPEARRLWQDMAALPRYKDDLRLRLVLFDLALKADDEPGMKDALSAIAGIERGTGVYESYGKALLAIWHCKKAKDAGERGRFLDSARQELDRVQAARPSWPALYLARGDAADLAGRPAETVANYQEAVNNGEGSPAVILRLAELLTERGDHGEAQKRLDLLKRAVLENAALGKLAVTVSIQRNQMEKALDQARAFIRDDTTNSTELVFIARVLAANKRFIDAEKKLDEAVKHGRTLPEPWLAKVQFLVEQKRRDEIPPALKEAARSIDPKKRALAMAQCCEVSGQLAECREWLAKALAESPDDPVTLRAVASAYLGGGRAQEAEKLMRRLADGDFPLQHKEWAARTLAVSLASSTDFRRFNEALALVGLKLDARGKLPPIDERSMPTELARATARVLASQGQKQFRKQAIDLLESLDRKGGMSPDDRFVLASLYEAEGDTARAQALLKRLAQPPQRTPRYLAQYATSLIAQKRGLDEAEKIAAMLEELERQREVGPNGFASIDLRARLLEAKGKPDAAVALMKAHVEREGAAPEEVLLLVGVLGRQKKEAQAYALCEKAWDGGKIAPEAVASAAASLLRVMTPTEAQVRSVEKRLRASIAAKPASSILRLQLADLLDRRG